jgi:hypothetical protein
MKMMFEDGDSVWEAHASENPTFHPAVNAPNGPVEKVYSLRGQFGTCYTTFARDVYPDEASARQRMDVLNDLAIADLEQKLIRQREKKAANLAKLAKL